MSELWRSQLAALRDQFRRDAAKCGGLYHAFLWCAREPHPFVGPPVASDDGRAEVELPLSALAALEVAVSGAGPRTTWTTLGGWTVETVKGRTLGLRECFFGSPRGHERFINLAETAARVVSSAPATSALNRVLEDFAPHHWPHVLHCLARVSLPNSSLRSTPLEVQSGATIEVKDAATGKVVGSGVELLVVAFVLGWEGGVAVDVFSASADAIDVILAHTDTDVRLVVDVGRELAWLDGETFKLTPEQTVFLAALCRVPGGPGGWVVGKQMGLGSPAKASRVRKSLPPPLRQIIESKSNSGYRLILARESVNVRGSDAAAEPRP